MKINPSISSLPGLQAPKAPAMPNLNGPEDFGAMMRDLLAEVNQSQNQSRQMQNDFIQGKPVEFHELMVTMEKASTAMQLTLSVRNKVLEAYQEINRIQV